MKLFHLNRASGWKIILVLIHQNETERKMILRNTSLSHVIADFGNFFKTFLQSLGIRNNLKNDIKIMIKQQSMVFINHMKTFIVTHSTKVK